MESTQENICILFKRFEYTQGRLGKYLEPSRKLCTEHPLIMSGGNQKLSTKSVYTNQNSEHNHA